jgi:hypothetical protein
VTVQQSAAAESETEPVAPPRRRRVSRSVLTGLACLPILFALIAPDQLGHYTPLALLRIPLEGLLAVPLLLLVPPRGRRWAAIAVGLVLGVLAVLKVFDLGFYWALDRPFDPVFDWSFFGNAVDYLNSEIGHTGAIACMILAPLLAICLVAVMTLAVLRVTRLLAAHRLGTLRTTAVLTVGWIAMAALGAQLVPGLPMAAESYDRLLKIRTSLQDHSTFEKQIKVDAFKNTPASQLLTGLRGKDVMFTFVESYGRDAVLDPRYAKQVDAVLDSGTAGLKSAGFGSRSAWLTSPTFGGGSWLAHSTLLSGTWVDNQQRYSTLVKTDRLNIPRAFRDAGWRTVSMQPGLTSGWPEGKFYGDEQVYDRWTIGYQGPRFNWGMPPDQYTLAELQRTELATPGRKPIFAEIPLVSSHSPWAPTPSMIDWKSVGNGIVYGPQATAGASPTSVWKDAWHDPSKVQAAYRGSIEYSLSALISFVKTYGTKNLVLVFLGDHQAAPIVTGYNASHDVPVTIVAADPAVLNRVSGWGWQDGLRPNAKAPEWRMDAFRDKFLTAFAR